eukprot:1083270-Amphidinium_carterae.1
MGGLAGGPSVVMLVKATLRLFKVNHESAEEGQTQKRLAARPAPQEKWTPTLSPGLAEAPNGDGLEAVAASVVAALDDDARDAPRGEDGDGHRSQRRGLDSILRDTHTSVRDTSDETPLSVRTHTHTHTHSERVRESALESERCRCDGGLRVSGTRYPPRAPRDSDAAATAAGKGTILREPETPSKAVEELGSPWRAAGPGALLGRLRPQLGQHYEDDAHLLLKSHSL